MPLRKTHGPLRRAGSDRRGDEFCELHGQSHSVGRSQTADRNAGILRVEQSLRDISRLARIDARNLDSGVCRDFQVAGLFLLQLDVDDDQRRPAGRRDCLTVGALDGGERISERPGCGAGLDRTQGN